MTPQHRMQIEAGARHLHSLGERATAEFLIALTEPVAELPLLIEMLQEYRCITPATLRMVGGDRFPPRLSPLPNERRRA
jgi:hypothetical protein